MAEELTVMGSAAAIRFSAFADCGWLPDSVGYEGLFIENSDRCFEINKSVPIVCMAGFIWIRNIPLEANYLYTFPKSI